MIKQPHLFAISGLLLVAAVGLFLWRGAFYLTSVEGQGTVVQVQSQNARCGSNKSRYDCTKFSAVIEYRVDGRAYRTSATAGDARGRSQPTTRASHRVGEKVPVLYSALDPSTACRNSVWDVWGMPIAALIGQVVTMVGSFFEGRRRHRHLF